MKMSKMTNKAGIRQDMKHGMVFFRSPPPGLRAWRLGGLWLLGFALWLSVCAPAWSQAAPVALVIGQNDYRSMGKLDNAVNDARLIASNLQSRGFEVTLLLNANATQMRQALLNYRDRLAASRRGIVYFAGHGAQIGDSNLLVPIDLTDISLNSLVRQSLTLQELVRTLAPTRPEALAIILDACRDNPLLENQVQKKGLGEAGIDLPPGFMVIYGASVGQTALDSTAPLQGVGVAGHGLFTSRFTQWFADPTLSLRQVIRRTRVEVNDLARKMGQQQLPSVYDALPRDSRFHTLSNAGSGFQAPGRAPAGPIRLIVPTAAGGPTDTVARVLVRRLQGLVGQPITIENIIDIAGQRVADLVGSAPPDGQTLLFSSYQASLARARRNDQRLVPVGQVTETPVLLVTHPNSGMRNLQQLVQRLRSTGQPLTVGVSGPGSPSEACANELRRVWGDGVIQTVAYRGSAPALADLLGANVDLNCDQAILFGPHVTANRVVPLANLQEDAVSEAGIATAQAQGYAAVVPNWNSLFAPAGTDPAIVRHLSQALQRVLADPAFGAELRGFWALPVTPDKGVPLEVILSLKVGLEVAR